MMRVISMRMTLAETPARQAARKRLQAMLQSAAGTEITPALLCCCPSPPPCITICHLQNGMQLVFSIHHLRTILCHFTELCWC